jgi:hypothetical protein
VFRAAEPAAARSFESDVRPSSFYFRIFRVTPSRLPAPTYRAMSPFWGSFFENVRGRGRNATLFLVVLAILFFALFASMIPSSRDLLQFADAVIAGIVVFLVAWFCVAAHKARERNRDRFSRRPLSCDELRVARSKLLRRKSPNVKRR